MDIPQCFAFPHPQSVLRIAIAQTAMMEIRNQCRFSGSFTQGFQNHAPTVFTIIEYRAGLLPLPRNAPSAVSCSGPNQSFFLKPATDSARNTPAIRDSLASAGIELPITANKM